MSSTKHERTIYGSRPLYIGVVTVISIVAIIVGGVVLWAFTPLSLLYSWLACLIVAAVVIGVVHMPKQHVSPVQTQPQPQPHITTKKRPEKSKKQVSKPEEEEVANPQPQPLQSDTCHLAVPAVYNRRRHWKSIVRQSAVSVGVVTLGALVILTTMHFLPSFDHKSLTMVIIVLVGLALVFLTVFREYELWKIHPITCDPNDGRLVDVQTKSLLWFYLGSPPDPYQIDDTPLRSPHQGWLEHFFFHSSNTIELRTGAGEDNIVLRDVVDVEHLLEIQRYRDTLEKHRVDLAEAQLRATEESNRIAREQLQATKENNNLLRQILDAGILCPSRPSSPPSKPGGLP